MAIKTLSKKAPYNFQSFDDSMAHDGEVSNEILPHVMRITKHLLHERIFPQIF
jgi:hypothetical protein